MKGKVFLAKAGDDLKPSLFSIANLALSKSGTINIELALHLVPQIVAYRVSRITAFLAKKILGFEVDHISPVNLLLDKRLVPELVQGNLTPEAIVDFAKPLLSDSKERTNMLKGYELLRKELGEPGVTERAAKEILDLIN